MMNLNLNRCAVQLGYEREEDVHIGKKIPKTFDCSNKVKYYSPFSQGPCRWRYCVKHAKPLIEKGHTLYLIDNRLRNIK